MEETGAAPPAEGSVGKALSDSTVDLDLMEELLSGDCWLDTANFSGFLQPSPLFSLNNSSSSAPRAIEEEKSEFSLNSPLNETPTELLRARSQIIPLKERLFHALKHIKDAQRSSDILIQIWLPTRRGDKHFLTTRGQPFWVEPNCRSLDRYRSVSAEYQFSAEANSNELVGLPGRVFLGKVPEWTPDVRYFSVEEYLRVDQAQQLSVSGTIALPVFERDSRSCIGVVEVVSTRQKINFSSDVESICNALQAVNLRSSDVLRVPRVKVSYNSYQAALPEIREVLKSVCETHSLPLAQTWISCIQQGKQGSRHSSENYKQCVSTVDDACYVKDPSMLGFHEACSEHHLFRGQGVAGKAFTTNQPCFSPDITSFMKTQYPLSHYAKLFNLQAAVAIRLRSMHTGSIDFVLEFFLPFNCIGSDQQKQMLNSLSITIQQVCQSLRVVTIKELDEEVMLHSDILFDESPYEGGKRQDDTNLLPSWVPSALEVQQMEESSALPSSEHIGFSKQETFAISSEWGASESVLSEGRIFSGFKNHSQNTADKKDACSSGPNCQRAGKSAEKRRAKTEKTVSLEVLRQYFAGSLKDAAKSIGVCPTTLKRICRHHGITRWPSRKIKKVGHSLKKLQGVIDSVQGAEGTFQFSSVYENFTKAPENFTIKQTDYPATSNTFQQKDGSFSPHSSGSNSSSSACSLSSSSSLGCSAGSKQSHLAPQFAIKQEAPVAESRAVKLVRANSEVEAHFRSQELQRSLIRSQSYEVLHDHPFPKNPFQLIKRSNLLKVKAVYGEEKIRFRLQPSWGFQELKQEIVRRFNISDIFSVDLKYFDDESEWVLLTCDADLQECVDVYKSSSVDTVKISVHQVAVPVSRASFP